MVTACKITLDELSSMKRKNMSVVLARDFLEYLKNLYVEAAIADYAFSYFVEDMLYWVTSDQQRLEQFMRDMYQDVSPGGIKKLDELDEGGD